MINRMSVGRNTKLRMTNGPGIGAAYLAQTSSESLVLLIDYRSCLPNGKSRAVDEVYGYEVRR